uniref:Uncharacterized protein n=1 Tax=Chenopodium quinoa TaxID=63459 RepID=A0A803MJK6_CHEQI
MAENQSPNLQLEDLSPENNGLSKVDDKESIFQTPEQKPGSQKYNTPNYTSETFLSSVSGSSDIYTKESSETASSPSSSDAESGTYDLPKKNYLPQHANGDEALQPEVIDLEFDTNGVEENHHIAIKEGKEGMLNEKEVLYEELLEKVANYEVELKLTKEKLESSQEEISKLKYENLTLVEELGGAIEKIRISEVNAEEMEKTFRIEHEEHRKQFQVQLDLANQSIDILQTELVSERRLVSELQETIDKITNELENYVCEVEELKVALNDAQKDFSKERSQFQYNITCLNEQKDALESKNKLLEEQIKQYELRETLDASKLKYDMLVVEKDEVFAKVQELVAELNARDTNMLQMEDRISKLTAEHSKLIEESEKTQKLLEEFRLKITDQEKELEKQRELIYDRSEEKREAIRQLCFSLEYYRNEYHELCQAFKYKRPAVLAA